MAPDWRRARLRRTWARATARIGAPTLVVLLVVALIVGGATQIGRASGPYLSTVDSGYAALVGVQARASSATGSALLALLGSLSSLARPTYLSELPSLAANARAEDLAARAAAPPEPADDIAGTCWAVFDQRLSATQAVVGALQAEIGGPDGTTALSPASAVLTIDDAVAALTGADTQWAACRRALRRAPGHARVPASTWVTRATSWSPPAMADVVNAVAKAPQLAAHHGLILTVFSTTPPSLTGSGAAVVPPTSTITVHLVVDDIGDVDEPAVQVQASLVPASSTASPLPLTAIVAVGSGRSVTVLLGPFHVQPGVTYALEVSATTPQGTGATSSSTPLVVAPLPPTTTTTTTTRPSRSTGTTHG